MRSEPEAWSLRVMTARPPAFSTAAATASESVATTTSPIAASRARRSTCTIIGTPLRSARGLPGRRVEARRAGMRTIASGIGIAGKPGRMTLSIMPEALIRVAIGQANRYLIAAAWRLSPHRHAPPREPSFDEFLRTQQDPRRHSRYLPCFARAQYRRGSRFCAAEAGKAGL